MAGHSAHFPCMQGIGWLASQLNPAERSCSDCSTSISPVGVGAFGQPQKLSGQECAVMAVSLLELPPLCELSVALVDEDVCFPCPACKNTHVHLSPNLKKPPKSVMFFQFPFKMHPPPPPPPPRKEQTSTPVSANPLPDLYVASIVTLGLGDDAGDVATACLGLKPAASTQKCRPSLSATIQKGLRLHSRIDSPFQQPSNTSLSHHSCHLKLPSNLEIAPTYAQYPVFKGSLRVKVDLGGPCWSRGFLLSMHGKRRQVVGASQVTSLQDLSSPNYLALHSKMHFSSCSLPILFRHHSLQRMGQNLGKWVVSKENDG